MVNGETSKTVFVIVLRRILMKNVENSGKKFEVMVWGLSANDTIIIKMSIDFVFQITLKFILVTLMSNNFYFAFSTFFKVRNRNKDSKSGVLNLSFFAKNIESFQ